MKEAVKRIIALLCTITLFLGSMSFGITAQATSNQLEQLTIADFGTAANSSVGVSSGYYTYKRGFPPFMTHANLIGTSFSVNLCGIGGALRYAAAWGEGGYEVKIVDASKLMFSDLGFKSNEVFYLTATEAGVTDFASPFKLTITLDAVEHDNDGNKDDLEFGFYINDNLCKTVYCDDQKAAQAKDYGFLYLYNVYAYDLDDYRETEYDKAAIEASGDMTPPVLLELSPSDYGFENKAYTAAATNTQRVDMEDKVFSTDVIFHTKDGAGEDLDNVALSYGPGVTLRYDKNAGTVLFSNSGFPYENEEADFEKAIGENIDISKTDTQFNLKISTESVDYDDDGYADDLKLGIFINDVLCDGTYYYSIDGFIRVQAANTVSVQNGVEFKAPSNSVPNGIRDLAPIDFAIEDNTYSNTKNGYLKVGWLATQRGLVDALFTTDITLHDEKEYQLWYGNDGNSFRFVIDSEQNFVVKETNTVYATVAADSFGIDNLVDTKFRLQICVQQGDADLNKDGKVNDLRVGFFVNGKLVGGKFYHTSAALADTYYTGYLTARNSLQFYTGSSDGASMTLQSPTRTFVESPESQYTILSPSNFGVADDTYTGYSAGTLATGTLNSQYGSLDKKVLSTKVKITGDKIWLALGGATDGGALRVDLYGDVITIRDMIGDSKGNLAQYPLSDWNQLTTGAELKISTSYINEYDVQVGVWIDGKLIGNRYFYLVNDVPNVSPRFGIYTYITENETVEVLLGEEKVPEGPVIPEVLDPELKKITFYHFEVDDGTYSYNNGNLSKESKYEGDLDGVYFCGNVTYAEGAELRFGGKGGWSGLKVSIHAQKLAVTDASGRTAMYAFLPEDAGLETNSFYNTPFDLGISIDYVDIDNDGEDDVKLGVWIDGVLCKNKYIYLTDYAQYLGNYIGIYCSAENSTLIVNSIKEFIPEIVPEKLDTTLTKITFDHFEIGDAVYAYNNGFLSSEGRYEGTLDGTYFCGNVIYSKGSELRFGGAGGWGGLKFFIHDNNLGVVDASGRTSLYLFTPAQAGLDTYYDTPFDLGISIKYVDSDADGEHDDVELGVWINGVLCKNKYIYLTDYAQYLGGCMGIYCSTEDATFAVHSKKEFIPVIIPVEVDADLKKITFSNFNVADGKYTYRNNDLAVTGNYPKSLDGTYFVGMVEFSSALGVQFRYGGMGGWSGLRIALNNEGKLILTDASGKTDVYSFIPQKAGLKSFKDTKFQLGYSIRYIDVDSDGQKDDVELGVWFNDLLYKNEYIYLVDYAVNMGSYMGIYSPTEASYINIETVYIPLDFSIFGFTSNWKKELRALAGGQSTASSITTESLESPSTGDFGGGNWLLLASAAVMGFVLMITYRKREREL